MLVKSVRISPVRREYGSWSSVFRCCLLNLLLIPLRKAAAQTAAKLEIAPPSELRSWRRRSKRKSSVRKPGAIMMSTEYNLLISYTVPVLNER